MLIWMSRQVGGVGGQLARESAARGAREEKFDSFAPAESTAAAVMSGQFDNFCRSARRVDRDNNNKLVLILTRHTLARAGLANRPY